MYIYHDNEKKKNATNDNYTMKDDATSYHNNDNDCNNNTKE